MVVLHGPFGLPGFLFPRGVHFKDLLSMFSTSRRTTRLKYLQRLFLILTFISAIYLLLMRSWHLIPITSIRRLQTHEVCYLSSCLLFVSAAYRSTVLALLLYNLIFLNLVISFNFQMLFRFLNAEAAFPILMVFHCN